MSKIIKKKSLIQSQEKIGEDIFSMIIKNEEISSLCVPGQFISLYCNAENRLLPRPISICEINKEENSIRIVYRIAGKGTDEFSKLKENDEIEIMGPLGNGFPLKNKKAIIIGGGIGIPPMLELTKQLECEKSIVLGYRDNLFLNIEFEKYGQVYISTEDGCVGTKGNVIDCIKENSLTADVIYACGPTPMLKGIKEFALENNIEAYLSLEERMACGIGACLACVCNSKDVDENLQVKNKRVCKEGPVFLAEEVLF